MKVKTRWWGEVDARYSRADDGTEFLRVEGIGVLDARDLSNTAAWDATLTKACEEWARTVKPQKGAK